MLTIIPSPYGLRLEQHEPRCANMDCGMRHGCMRYLSFLRGASWSQPKGFQPEAGRCAQYVPEPGLAPCPA